ncbi:hypothetical protein [uncultured Deinococcus sp.]|uniref:hypothetical protein n=1 Tax=uncultured Deinococcus sp. TaxID=158789 RepID=UPI00259015DD|nr:hypothetical protein [uncultured Deinococcus sp.]
MTPPTPRPGTGRQVLLLVAVLALGMALGVTCRDLILTVVGALVSTLAVIGDRR